MIYLFLEISLSGKKCIYSDSKLATHLLALTLKGLREALLIFKALTFPADINDLPCPLSRRQEVGHFWREEQLFLLRWNNSRESGSLRKRHTDSPKRGEKKKRESCWVEENMSAHFPQERKDEAAFLK